MNAVVTRDGKYVIISASNSAASLMQGDHLKYVHLLDVEDNFKWKRTNIKLPIIESTDQMMFRTGNAHRADIMVNGFVRKQYRNQIFKNLLEMPTVLVTLIQAFFSQELIHWTTGDKHFAIPITEILSAPYEDYSVALVDQVDYVMVD